LGPIFEGDHLKWDNLKRDNTQAESPAYSDVQVSGSIGEVILPLFG